MIVLNKNRIIQLSLVVLAFGALLLFSNSFDGTSVQLSKILTPPTLTDPFGHDELGRSILIRVIAGAALAFKIAFTVMIFSFIIGVSIGLISGYFGGWVDQLLMRIVDVFLAFPGLLLAIVLAGVLGPGINNLIIALVSVGWIGYARIMRVQTLTLIKQDHVTAAKSMGLGTVTIWIRHILPLAASPLLIEATFGFAGTIISEAGLSFLGLGVQPPDPSWGQMIREGARYMLVAPHYILFPSLVLWLTVAGINHFGERLRKHWLPTQSTIIPK